MINKDWLRMQERQERNPPISAYFHLQVCLACEYKYNHI